MIDRLRILYVPALLLAFTEMAFADGQPRYIEEGEVKVRFYYDSKFLSDYYSSYRWLYSDLFNSLRWTGKYRLGIKFVRDNADYEREVDMSAREVWSRDQIGEFMDEYLPISSGIVKVLLHARGMTSDGVCLDDIPGSGNSSYDYGLTWRSNPPPGTASAHLAVTVKVGCSQNSFQLQSQVNVKNTFIHEIAHALGHNASASPAPQCSTPPNASIVCHSVSNGARRYWKNWFNNDIDIVRNYVFDGSSAEDRIVDCYKYSSYSSCSDQCANGAGFPNPGATGLFENCIAQYCGHICN